MSVRGAVLVLGLVVTIGIGSITSALNSPCPDLFHYDSTDQPGQWTGTVTLLSDVELHGVWIRLIFDEKLTKLDVGDNFGEVVTSDNQQEILIKNRNVLLKAVTPRNIKITVKYDGNKVPNLIGYRLNANMVCAAGNTISEDFFPGDLASSSFLTSLASNKKVPEEFEGCGTAPLFQDNDVENGKSQAGRWPWQAAIFIQKKDEEQYVCGGTVVSSRYVITSAHCVTYQKSELVVPVRRLSIYLGKYSHNGSDNEQKFKATRIIVHPGYRASSVLDDIAVIELDDPIVVNDYVRPICLKNSSDKKAGFLVGYGINQDRKIEDLTQAEVKIISEDECSQRSSDVKSLLTDNVLCAGYVQDNSLCVGDSGSSLALLREGSRVWDLKGVVTVGVGLQDKYVCNHSSTVFITDIANYLKWIQEVIS